MSYESRELVSHYLCYRISRHGYVWEEAAGGSAGSSPASAARDKLYRVLREVGDGFERQYQQEFADIALQMRFEPEGARGRFDAVAEELFRDGINWGRIVALFVFGGTLCVESCKRRDMAPRVDSIAAWMTAYLDSSLATWISANGDWDAFVELYGNNVHRFFDIPLPHLWTALAFAAVVTCVTVAYLAHQY